MQTTGIDRVVFMVKDMDKAKDFFAKLFGLEFIELADTVEQGGIRVCVGLPDGRVEVISVVDPEKTEKEPFLKRTAELARSGYEGPYAMAFSIEDGRTFALEAERKGFGVEMTLEGEHPGVVPPYREVFFKEDQMPIKGIFAMSRHPKPEESA